METLKICIVSRTYPKLGDHRGAFVQARVELYRKMGHEVSLCIQDDGKAWDVGARWDYNIVAVHTPLPDWGIPVGREFKRRGLPVVAFVHGSEAIHIPVLWDPKFSAFAWTQKMAKRNFLLFDCRAIVTESNWMYRKATDYFGTPFSGKVHVIPNPVDPELFPLIEHAIPESGVCIRGDHPKYGVDVLRKVMRLWPDSPVEILEPKFSRAELQGVLRNYGFFVAPSRMEGQGLMACEAAATGMGVVTTTVGGIPEFISSSKHILIDRLNSHNLAAAIQLMSVRCLRSTESFRNLIREDVLSRCGPDATVKYDIDLFRKLMDNEIGLKSHAKAYGAQA